MFTTSVRLCAPPSGSSTPSLQPLLRSQVRQLLITLCNVLGAVACAILCMYPISRAVTVSAEAPALMLAAALALSVDYSLFLLSRFNAEV